MNTNFSKSYINTLIEFFFNKYKDPLFKKLRKTIIFLSIYSAIVVIGETFFNKFFDKMQLTNLGQFHLIFSFVLSILVVFRVNSSYSRWWEGRSLWGNLVNNSRNLALKFNNYIGLKNDPLFNQCLQNFPRLFKHHLRRHRPTCENILNELGLKFKPTDHLPTVVINYMYQRINFYRNNNQISLEQYLVIDTHLANIIDVIGGCEKISNTPIPAPFKIFVNRSLHFYMIVFPFGWVEIFGVLIIPIIIVFVYILSGLEILAEDMEDPFEENETGHYNNLPLDTISETIKNNVVAISEFERI
jgi:putative membrane protein